MEFFREAHRNASGVSGIATGKISGFDGGAETTVHFAAGEAIHTEKSCKFTASTLSAQLVEAGFMTQMVWNDTEFLFNLTLAEAF